MGTGVDFAHTSLRLVCEVAGLVADVSCISCFRVGSGCTWGLCAYVGLSVVWVFLFSLGCSIWFRLSFFGSEGDFSQGGREDRD